MGRLTRVAAAVVSVGLVVGAAWWATRPVPVVADLATVETGPMSVTVDEEGVTRIKERYTVSSPLTGRLRRIALDPGDAVTQGATELAYIEPSLAGLLDPRTLAEGEARVSAAAAAAMRAGTQVEEARAQYDLAENELTRVRQAAAQGAASASESDRAETALRTASEGLRAAQYAEEIARFELELARAAISFGRDDGRPDPAMEGLRIVSPVSGRVLRLFEESDAVVVPGTPLLEIGDPTDIEVVVDILSTDAVRVEPGDEVRIDHWGGDRPLVGRVRVVEPAGFTKVSALGIEEQRVNVVIEFVSPPADRRNLGDAYRVEASIVVWHAEDVTTVPTSAVFRHDSGWAVYRIEAGRAALRSVQMGARSPERTQITGGLTPGDRVVVYPSDRIDEGTRVRPAP